jgi:hypothetical protein
MVIVWPLIAYRIFKKYNKDTALILLIIVPYLFLPLKTVIDFPALPPLTKTSIAAFITFFLFYRAEKNFKFLPESKVMRRLLILMFLFPLLTWWTNTDSQTYGSRFLKSLSFIDFQSTTVNHFSMYYLPLILGIKYLRTAESHKNFIKLIIITGLIYSIPTLYEAFFSPQLHSKIYGFFPHDWRQQIRQGGFRPVVFLGHGLLVAMFTCIFVFACITAFKQKLIVHRKLNKPFFIALFSIFLLLSCKSLGVVVYAIAIIPCILLLKPKMQIHIATMLAVVVFLFPFLRAQGLVPVNTMTEYFMTIDSDRAYSLKYRFDNEDILLDKANVRPLFGWGTWGRNRVFDPETGSDLATTDGYWIIMFGTYGWFGYIALFGVLVWPIYIFKKVSNKVITKDKNEYAYTACLCLILAINLIDLLPNSSISQLTSLIAGAILGRAEELSKTSNIKRSAL